MLTNYRNTMNDWTLKRISFSIGYFLLDLAIVWVAFWFVNGVVWLASLGVEGIFTGLLGREGGTFGKVIVYMLDLIWLYGIVMLMILMMATHDDRGNQTVSGENLKITLIEGATTCLAVILIYDPRIAAALPSFLSAPLEFLQTEWNFRLVGGADLMRLDFSGGISDPVYYNLFDLMIAGAWVVWLVFCKTKRPQYDYDY